MHPISSRDENDSQSSTEEVYSKFPLAVYFTYGNTYVSRLLSQFIPLSPSPAVSTSLFSIVCVSIAVLQIDSSVPSF